MLNKKTVNECYNNNNSTYLHIFNCTYLIKSERHLKPCVQKFRKLCMSKRKWSIFASSEQLTSQHCEIMHSWFKECRSALTSHIGTQIQKECKQLLLSLHSLSRRRCFDRAHFSVLAPSRPLRNRPFILSQGTRVSFSHNLYSDLGCNYPLIPAFFIALLKSHMNIHKSLRYVFRREHIQ